MITQSMVDKMRAKRKRSDESAQLRAENDRLRAILQQVAKYDRHTLNCTRCACGLYCRVEARERREIMKAVYRELEE